MPLENAAQETVAKMQVKLDAALAEAEKWKRNINGVFEANDEPPPYALGEGAGFAASQPKARQPYGPADFYSLSLTPVVRKIIEDRGPLNIDDLYSFMFEGGYAFEESNPDKAKNNLKISLGKSIAFGKTPNGVYTIAPAGAQRSKRKPDATAQNGNAAEPTADTADEGAQA